MADVYAALMQQILYMPERERETDVKHHREVDDLWACFELLKRLAFCDAGKGGRHRTRLRSVSFDNPIETDAGIQERAISARAHGGRRRDAGAHLSASRRRCLMRTLSGSDIPIRTAVSSATDRSVEAMCSMAARS